MGTRNQHKTKRYERLKSGFIFAVFSLLLLGNILVSSVVKAQETKTDETTSSATAPVNAVDTEVAAEADTEVAPYKKQSIIPTSIPPILFTKWEYEAIMDAIKAIGQTSVRQPTQSELREAEEFEEGRFRRRPPPEERDITLNGLVYGGKGDWTIWLNGKRITPDAIPREVIDLRVFKDYIEVKWYDDYSRSIYPIKLRPHQRFNLDTRIFLPG